MTDQDHSRWLDAVMQQKRERQLALIRLLHSPRDAEGEPLGEEDEAGDERPRDERGRFTATT